MSRISQRGVVAPFSMFSTDTDASLKTLVGTKWDTSDGRELTFVFNSSAGALTAGTLVQAPIIIANHVNLTTVVTTYTAAIGATQIQVTLGGTAITKDQYQGGYAVINAGTGIGQTLKISGNAAQATTTGNVVITLEDPLMVALSETSKVSLYLNQFYAVIASVNTARPIGVTIAPLAASTYGFVCNKGLVSALNQGGTTVILGLAPSTTSGAMETVAATTTQIAMAAAAGTSGENAMVLMMLP